MPREIAHFLAVDHVVENLPELKAIVDSRKLGLEALYLGSITPDSPYYLPTKGAEQIAEYIHGRSGNDTFCLLRSLLEKANKGEEKVDPLLDLFVIGIFTHIVMDAVMHPLVNLLSGNYYDSNLEARKHARTLHRTLETDLDYYLLNIKKPKHESLHSLLCSLKSEIETLSTPLNSVLRDSGYSSSYRLYWQIHSILNSIFDRKSIISLNLFPPEIEALCGRGREPHELLYSKMKYPTADNMYFKYVGSEVDLRDLYALGQVYLLEQVKLFIADTPKCVSLRGPSLENGKV